jgi:hypothetical protein
MLKKFFDHKIWVVLATCLALLMLVFLAAGLDNLHFQPGRPFTQGKTITFQISIEKISDEIASIPVWKQVVFVLLVFLLVVIVVAVIPSKWRKKFLKYFLRYALIVLLLFFIVKNFRVLLPALNLAGAQASKNIPPNTSETPQSVFIPPQIPSVIMYLISLGVVAALALVVFLISRWWMQNQGFRKKPLSLEGLAQVARSSLADISSGRNWENVIINCYARMSDVVSKQRGLHRRMDLTASEFALRLENSGLPGEAVRRLTRLFEAVRYGVRRASQEEKAEAIACLTSVIHACGIDE